MGSLAKVQIESFVGLIFNLHGTKPETQTRLRPQAVIPHSSIARAPIWQPQRAIQTISTSFLCFALFGLPFGAFYLAYFCFHFVFHFLPILLSQQFARIWGNKGSGKPSASSS